MAVAECSVVITLTVLLAIQPVCCTQNTYFVKPTPDTPCPSEPCFTLSEYAQGAGPPFTSNITMLFLPGDHRLYNDIEISNITSFTMVGDSATLLDITRNIVCTSPAAFIFQNISYLKIHALELSYCGSATLAAVQLSAIPKFELSNSAFYNSRNTSIKVTGSSLTITETTFYGSSSGGLWLWGCTAEFLGSNVFSNNLESGVQSFVSIISFNGITSFVNNNSGKCGGGILAASSTIHSGGKCTTITKYDEAESDGGSRVVRCNGEMIFVQNSAEQGGGICAVLESDLNFSGNLIFANNSATNQGGGILIQNSRLSCEGLTTSFVSNSARVGGGIASTIGSQITLSENTSFSSNTAQTGGGIAVVLSIISVKGYTSFANNFAYTGGGLSAVDSTMTFNRFNSFINNSASLAGGGIHMIRSRLSCEGLTSFVGNSARAGGGIGGYNGSHMTFTENTSFISNTAEYGGGIFVNGNVMIKGYTSFVNNFAYSGGGLTALGGSVTCEGFYGFINNSATYSGGGVLIESSSLSCEGLMMFTSNEADYGGGIASADSQITFTSNIGQDNAEIRSTKDESILYFNECVSFSSNLADFGGGLYSFNSSVDFYNCSSTFTENEANVGAGIAVAKSIALTFSGISTFTNNSAKFSGGAMYIYDTSLVTLNGTTKLVENSGGFGGGMYFYNGNLKLTGNTYFYNNNAINGGGIHGTTIKITINGNTTFEDNYALINGGGLSLSSSSQCFLAANESMSLVNNHAEQYGGAIYVADDPSVYCSSYRSVNLRVQCFFQELSDDNGTSVTYIIENNTAGKAGAAIYGGMVDECSPVPDNHGFDEIFSINEGNVTTSVISSDPNHVCPCTNSQPDCTKHSITITVYPGEIFLVPVVAVGQRNGTVPAVITSSLEDKHSMFNRLQRAQSVNNTCTALQYVIFSKNSKETMTLEAEGPCLELGEPLIINITLLQCPIGFMLSSSTKGCTCEKRLQKYTSKCNITSRKIYRDREFWVGVDSGFGGTIFHTHCPFDYCKSHPVSFALNETDLECSYDRTGLLCGGCQPGLSNVLGSSRCIKCSDAYLSLLIPFALAGIALVAFLLLCKLTVTVGSINGLIFYANIIAVNHSVFLPSGQQSVLTIFIAWFNLDLGIEICFYDGMDTYARTWLQFAFPLYMWVIVGTIVIFSHYYSTVARVFGRNPVAILATLFLLSYAKLLRTIIAVLSFTYLEYPDGAEVAVWLYDGNVRYLKGKHIPLFLTALLVLLLLFLPYTLLLLFGQWNQAHSEKRIFSWISNYRVKPILDAYHAPYRNEYRYWPGLLLVLRCILFLVFAFNVLGNPSVNLLTISVCTTVVGVILTRFTGKVYTNQYLDAIDASHLLNIGVLASGTLYVRSVGGRQDIIVYTSLSIAFTTFLAVLIYHIIAQVRDSRVWKETICPKLQGMRQRIPTSIHRDLSDTDTQRAEPAIPSARAPTTTYINLRELLLEVNS